VPDAALACLGAWGIVPLSPLWVELMPQSLKQQVRNAIKSGDLELALELLKGLRNPEPSKPKKASKLDQPYRLPFVIK